MIKRIAILLFTLAPVASASFVPGPIQVNASGGTATAVGYATGGSSVPVSVLNFPATQAVTQSGVFQVEPGSNTFKASIVGSITQNVNSISTAAVAGALADNGAAAGTNRVATLPAIYQSNYLAGTAATVGRNGALSQGTDGLLWTAFLPSMRPAGFQASTGTITSAASATDISCISGNATNTVLLMGMRVSCNETTAGSVPMTIIKRSTAFTGAWSTMTTVADDSTMNVGASTATWFGANPTVGTRVGEIADYKLGCMAAATAAPGDMWVSPASWRQRPIVLRGASQSVCVNLNSTTVTGGSFTVGYEWLETATITP